MSSSTADALRQSGVRPRLPPQRLRDTIMARLRDAEANGASRGEALQGLFPETLLDTPTLESVVAALLSGTNLLLIGPPGSGKTSLARAVWDLYPREAIVVEGCPVQDDAFSLIDAEFAAHHPACPACRSTHGHVAYREVGDFDTAHVDAKKVKVRTTRLREGYGFARLQGSPEVFPDYLTGAINLTKLEEIGDPESPLVLEPGKLMQANGGVLLIDEVGKLPRGTQNVLLQALQESIVTPSKSRETFPAAFVCVATSNVDDLDVIEAPLLGRFTSVFVGFNEDHDKNRAVVDMGIKDAALTIPPMVREATVHLIARWRKTAGDAPDMSEVASNRGMLDILRRAEARALMRHDDLVSLDDLRQGAQEGMIGRIRGRSAEGYHENRAAVEAFLDSHFDASVGEACERLWCRFQTTTLEDDKAEGARTASEAIAAAKDDKRLAAALKGDASAAKLARFFTHLDSHDVPARDAEARTRAARELLATMVARGTFEANA